MSFCTGCPNKILKHPVIALFAKVKVKSSTNGNEVCLFYDYMARCIFVLFFLGRIARKALKPLILRHTTQNIRNTSMAINMESCWSIFACESSSR